MAPFDPYHKWLGIPPDQQPVSHYRLLGIEDFESDADVIEMAAEQRTLLLRTFQTGPNSELAERLLNEVSAARVCLLDGKSKARYDTQLKATLEPAPEDDPLAFTTEELAAVVSKPATRPRQRSRSRGGKPFWQEPWATAGGGAIVMLLIMLIFGSGEEAKESGQGLEQELQAEIASLKEKLVAAGNGKGVGKSLPAGSETLPAKVAVAPPLAVAPFDAAQATAHQQAWSKYLGVPVEYTNSIGMKFMLIPPGEFMMGAIDGESGDLKSRSAEATRTPAHSVRISKPFYLGKYEVTQSEYKKCTEPDPEMKSGTSESRLPKKNISWHDADSFPNLMKLAEKKSGNVLLGLTPHYRLPTEAEWEYAARAGTETDHFAGNTQEIVADYEWNIKNAARSDKPVGGKKASPWGLHDLGGNVYEWCLNWGSYSYYNGEFTIDPPGPSQSTGRKIIRSSSTFYDPFPLWHINTLPPSAVDVRIGFRVVLEIPVKAQPNTIAAETKSLPASLQEGLVAFYPFNGNAQDESGNGNHGEVHGAVLNSDRHGEVNQSFSFDGKSYIEIPDKENLSGFESMTLSLWSYRPADIKRQSNEPEGLVTKWFQNKNEDTYAIWLNRQGNFKSGNSIRSFEHTQLAAPASFGNWQQLVYVHDTKYGDKFYSDGTLVSRDIETRGSIRSSSVPLYIGADNKGGETWRHFKGSIDDIRIYNRALSAAEVKTLYEFEKP